MVGRHSRRAFLAWSVAAGATLAGCTLDDGTPSDAPPGTDGTPSRTSSDAATVDSAWPAFAHDAANSGAVPGGEGPADLSVAWRRTYEGPMFGQPVFADGAVLVPTGKRLVALDPADGSERWSFDPDEPVSAPPVVGAGQVFVGTRLGSLYALDPADGGERWQADVGGDFFVDGPTFAGDRLFAAPWNGTVTALGTDGGTRWTGDDVGGPYPTAAAAGRFYAPTVGESATRSLTAYDGDDGSVRWTRSTVGSAENAAFGAVAAADGVVVAGADLSRVEGVDQPEAYTGYSPLALDADDGAVRWAVPLDGETLSNPPVMADDAVLVPGGDADADDVHLYAFGHGSGDVRRRVRFDGVGEVPTRWSYSGATLVGDRLYLAGGDGSGENAVTVVPRGDWSAASHVPLALDAYAPPTVTADAAYLTGRSGQRSAVVALRPD